MAHPKFTPSSIRFKQYKDKIASINSLTAIEWDDYDRLFKSLDPEGYKRNKEESARKYRIKLAKELSTEDLQLIIDERKFNNASV